KMELLLSTVVQACSPPPPERATRHPVSRQYGSPPTPSGPVLHREPRCRLSTAARPRADPERGSPCAHAYARAREIIEVFSPGSIACRYRTTASRTRRYHADHADIGAGLVTTLSISGQRPA